MYACTSWWICIILCMRYHTARKACLPGEIFCQFCHLASLMKILSTNLFLFYTHRSQGVATNYCITPTFRGTKFSWISWFDFWSRKVSSQKFSIIVGVATFQAHWKCDRAYTCTHTSERINCLKRSIESLLTMYRLCVLTFKNEQKLPTKSARTSVQTTSFILPSIEFTNSHVEKMTKHTIAEGAKGR